jgi:hypothetical protein
MKKLYCQLCGKQCIEVKVPGGYDKFTGKPKVRIKIVCPTVMDKGGFEVSFVGTYLGHHIYN